MQIQPLWGATGGVIGILLAIGSAEPSAAKLKERFAGGFKQNA